MFYNTGYVADMMDLLFEEVFVNPTPYTDELLDIPVPEYLSGGGHCQLCVKVQTGGSLNPT